MSFGDFLVLLRDERPGEQARNKEGLEWGVDHFGLAIGGDFDGYCSELKKAGVDFSLEPANINPSTRIAFIRAPDGVSIELVSREN